MKKSQFYAGIVCFVLAALLFLMDVTKWEFMTNHTTIIIYPAIFLAMMGVLLVVISRRKPAS
jgi:YbbR domain-containing protein